MFAGSRANIYSLVCSGGNFDLRNFLVLIREILWKFQFEEFLTGFDLRNFLSGFDLRIFWEFLLIFRYMVSEKNFSTLQRKNSLGPSRQNSNNRGDQAKFH
jgi:hypothetical protein